MKEGDVSFARPASEYWIFIVPPYVNYDFKMSIGSCQNEKFGHYDAIRSSGGSQASAEDDHYDSALAR
jgi:hypothetical protein